MTTFRTAAFFWWLTVITTIVVNGGPVKWKGGFRRNVYSSISNDSINNGYNVCTIDDVLYQDGDAIPTASPCEKCVCRPPGFACVNLTCEAKPGCRAVQRPAQCCPEYKCECERDGRIYQNGERLHSQEGPCQVCYCKGGEVICADVECYRRDDCKPQYVPGVCCPKYDHCPPLGQRSTTVPPPPPPPSVEMVADSPDQHVLDNRAAPSIETVSNDRPDPSSEQVVDDQIVLSSEHVLGSLPVLPNGQVLGHPTVLPVEQMLGDQPVQSTEEILSDQQPSSSVEHDYTEYAYGSEVDENQAASQQDSVELQSSTTEENPTASYEKPEDHSDISPEETGESVVENHSELSNNYDNYESDAQPDGSLTSSTILSAERSEESQEDPQANKFWDHVNSKEDSDSKFEESDSKVTTTLSPSLSIAKEEKRDGSAEWGSGANWHEQGDTQPITTNVGSGDGDEGSGAIDPNRDDFPVIKLPDGMSPEDRGIVINKRQQIEVPVVEESVEWIPEKSVGGCGSYSCEEASKEISKHVAPLSSEGTSTEIPNGSSGETVSTTDVDTATASTTTYVDLTNDTNVNDGAETATDSQEVIPDTTTDKSSEAEQHMVDISHEEDISSTAERMVAGVGSCQDSTELGCTSETPLQIELTSEDPISGSQVEEFSMETSSPTENVEHANGDAVTSGYTASEKESTSEGTTDEFTVEGDNDYLEKSAEIDLGSSEPESVKLPLDSSSTSSEGNSTDVVEEAEANATTEEDHSSTTSPENTSEDYTETTSASSTATLGETTVEGSSETTSEDHVSSTSTELTSEDYLSTTTIDGMFHDDEASHSELHSEELTGVGHDEDHLMDSEAQASEHDELQDFSGADTHEEIKPSGELLANDHTPVTSEEESTSTTTDESVYHSDEFKAKSGEKSYEYSQDDAPASVLEDNTSHEKQSASKSEESTSVEEQITTTSEQNISEGETTTASDEDTPNKSINTASEGNTSDEEHSTTASEDVSYEEQTTTGSQENTSDDQHSSTVLEGNSSVETHTSTTINEDASEEIHITAASKEKSSEDDHTTVASEEITSVEEHGTSASEEKTSNDEHTTTASEEATSASEENVSHEKLSAPASEDTTSTEYDYMLGDAPISAAESAISWSKDEAAGFKPDQLDFSPEQKHDPKRSVIKKHSAHQSESEEDSTATEDATFADLESIIHRSDLNFLRNVFMQMHLRQRRPQFQNA